ncbi:hypothetical protein O181_063838 [Austropuccinia psidii MF-1]|uniref:SEC7 domain-containing protein n=1 Tax=Austropuccinia psidii MF-1 TaxID=1389203 RepID=A0A9Q3I0Z6_9BASI|nr:hypothetical protein [Austropuccinia psidii MF-1]
MNQTALIDYISHHTSNVPLTPKPNHKYIIKSPTHSIQQQQHPQQQQLTKQQDQDHDQDQDPHSNFSISTKDPSNLISNSSTSPIRPRPTPKPRSKEPLPSSSQFLLSQHQSNLSSNLTSLNHHQHHHQFKSQESQESQASQLDSNYHLPDLPSAISSFNVNIFSNNSSSNFNQNQSSSNHILNHHQTYSPILQSHSSNLQKDLFEKNSINSDLNQTSSISKPFHQSSNSSLQTSSTPFNKNSSIINNPPLNPINSNLTPPQSIHSTPQSPSKFKSNHSISNSDSMLNLTNIHLHQSAPTIYPASLLHPPHLNDLLTIHPSKLNLKGKHKSIEPLLSSLPLTDLKSSSKPSQSSQLTDLENSNIHQTLHKHSDLQQSPKHLHQYLDSNISPLSTYQTPQSSFHPPLESDNHFITRSKRSNSSNSVPSNSQKSFQTDSQTTQSPFQNRSGSIASTSRSRTPSVLKLIKTGFRSKTPSFSSSLAHCDQSSARLSSSSFYSSPANKAQAVKSSSSFSSSLSSSHLNQDVRAHDLQIKTQDSKPSEIDHHNPLVANQFKSSWILQRSQSDSANHLPHYKASLAKRFLIRPQTSISIASIPKPTPKKLEVQTELTKDHDCQNLHLQIKPVVRNLHQSDQIEKAQENNNNVALVSNKEKVNQHERKTSVDKKAKEKVLLERLNDQESPEEYLERLSLVVGQSRIPSVLATSSNEYYQSVLLQFMTLFEFGHDPIDLALRKFLMIVYLPKETQEIDRVIENFSKRYLDCNPKLFNSHG